MKFFDLFLACCAGFFLCFWIMSGSIIEKTELAYEKGYNNATYETAIECGAALHVLVEEKCPEIYNQLMHTDKPGYKEKQIKELEERKKRYLKQIKQLNKGETRL